MEKKLDSLFAEEKLTLTEEQKKKLVTYADILKEWNAKINLTAITDDDGICEKHFLDSLLPLKYFELTKNAKVIDVGTGAGFPGIPIKIYRDDVELTLLDSLNKRINFLTEVCKAIGISADCIHARAEDGAKRDELREQFDIATARAVANLPVLCEYCLPYVKVGGYFVALKGPNEEVDEGKKAISILGGKIQSVNDYELPCGDKRRLIIIKKISHTPTKYPRNSGQIAKSPL